MVLHTASSFSIDRNSQREPVLPGKPSQPGKPDQTPGELYRNGPGGKPGGKPGDRPGPPGPIPAGTHGQIQNLISTLQQIRAELVRDDTFCNGLNV